MVIGLHNKNLFFKNKENLRLESKNNQKVINSCINSHRKHLTQTMKSFQSTNSGDNWKILNRSNVLLRSSFDFLKNTYECSDSITEDVNILSSTVDYHNC